MIPKWDTWHKVVLTTEQIKAAIGDRLLSCHTSERKRKMQEAALIAAGGGELIGNNGANNLNSDSNEELPAVEEE